MKPCPTPTKKRYRSKAAAKRAERLWRPSEFNPNPVKERLYPYLCPSGEHWHLTHYNTPPQTQQRATGLVM